MNIAGKKSIFYILVAFTLVLLVGFYLILLCYTYVRYNPTSLLTLVRTPAVSHAIMVSVISATIATVLALFFSVPASYFLSRNEFFGKVFIDALLDIPVFVSPVALGALLLVLFSSPVGIRVQGFLFPVVFALPGIIVAQFTVVTGLSIRLLKATFDQIPSRYEEVARTLGCSPFQSFCKVTLPLSKNGILAAGIIAWARAIGEFGATITLVGAAEMKTETIPTAVYLSFASADVDRALTMVAILILTALSGLVIIRMISGGKVLF
ncbi:MAG: ABC transporter permease [Deltaproteobacteria bacterium]|nr:ABC transporter permease [Deltaproteobacteria bacterium]